MWTMFRLGSFYIALVFELLLLLQTVVTNDVNIDPKDNAIVSSYVHPRHRKRECLELPLDDRVKQAEFIFTGTVRSVESDSSGLGTHTATVEVKRFFKGQENWMSERVKRTVVLAGTGDDSRLCQSHVRRRDSWIFLANRQTRTAGRDNSVAGGRGVDDILVLNSSLITVTLENIDNIDSAVKRFVVRMPTTRIHRPQTTQLRPPTIQMTPVPTTNPCLLLSCRYLSRCVVSDDRLTARCQCPTMHCGNSSSNGPVCGNDGNDYSDECEMKSRSCSEQRSITKKYNGFCDSCRGVYCEFHGICVIDNLGGSQCTCSSDKSCNNEQVVGNVSICGSDGKFYSSECELKVTSCRLRQRITKAPTVVCDRCAGISCERRGQVCIDGLCMCRQTPCPAIYNPVCGSDSVTYPNQCKLDEVACTDDRDISTLHEGACIDDGFGSGDSEQVPASASDSRQTSGKRIADELNWSHPTRVRCDVSLCNHGATCEAIGPQQTHRCVCLFSCDAVRSAVCASDGNIYASECQMRETACRKQIDLTVQPIGNCEDVVMETELCDGRPQLVNRLTGDLYDCDREQCPAGSYCHRLAMTARCCPAADDTIKKCELSEYGCCSDGVTISPGPNQAGCPDKCSCNTLGSQGMTCDPKTLQCRCKQGVGGRTCDHCDTSYWGMHLIRDINSGCIACGCNVFGSERDDCDQMTGRCVCQPGMKGTKCNICPNGAHVGSQGCVGMDIMQNDKSPYLQQGAASIFACPLRRCSHGSVCDVNTAGRLPRCTCPFQCDEVAAADEQSPSRRRPDERSVCGTDGRTYKSLCFLKQESCRRQRRINVARQGPCWTSSRQSV